MLGLEPSCQPDVIGVVVRDHNAAYGFAAQRPRHDLGPDAFGLFRGKTSVDDRPAVALVQRIDVHVVKLHG